MNSDNISNMAARYTEYDMITSHTALPEFPKHRIDLLCAFLKNGAFKRDLAMEEQQLHGLAISLMQLGLDTHDMVSGSEAPDDEKAMRSNQLKVLAGDYFSSRFYQLLANKGYIDLIQRISRSISELNHIKMDLYLNIQQLRMTAEEYITQSALVKTQLFMPFKHMMKQSFGEMWSALLNDIAHCEVIVEQLVIGDSALQTDHSWAFWFKKEQPMSNLRDVLIDMLDKRIKGFQDTVKQIDSEQLNLDLGRIGQSLSDHLHMPGKQYEVQA